MPRTKKEITRALKRIAENTSTRYWVGNALSNIIELEGMQELAFESLKLIESQPDIVRCKDCDNAIVYDENEVICAHIDSNGNDTHSADWFCADGKRREQTDG